MSFAGAPSLRSRAAALLACATLAATVHAQELPLRPGDSVRVELRPAAARASGERLVGRYVGAFRDTLTLHRVAGDTLSVPMTRIREIHAASAGRPIVRYLLWGAALGGAAGVVAGLPMRDDQTVSDPNGFIVWTGALGAAVGGLTGLALGSKSRTIWRRVWRAV